ncbi:DsbA family protein [Patescibacteria group bacterium]|nr:DsbA family protein [Patescibacteria group bacterium]
MKKDYLLPVSILVAAVLIAGAVIYSAGTTPAPSPAGQQQPSAAVDANALKLTSDDVVLGDLNAPVTLIEYGDYQCTFCGRFFSETESQIVNNYVKTGKVRLVFRNFPFLGPESAPSANAAECAKDQGKFWEYHDALFTAEVKDGQENNGNLTRGLFMSLASNLGLDTTQFGSCLDSNKYASLVASQKSTAISSLGVQATPTFFLGTQKIEGALPYDQFKTDIDQALAAATTTAQ